MGLIGEAGATTHGRVIAKVAAKDKAAEASKNRVEAEGRNSGRRSLAAGHNMRRRFSSIAMRLGRRCRQFLLRRDRQRWVLRGRRRWRRYL